MLYQFHFFGISKHIIQKKNNLSVYENIIKIFKIGSPPQKKIIIWFRIGSLSIPFITSVNSKKNDRILSVYQYMLYQFPRAAVTN